LQKAHQVFQHCIDSIQDKIKANNNTAINDLQIRKSHAAVKKQLLPFYWRKVNWSI